MATNHNGDQGSGRGLLHPAGAHKLQCCFSNEMSCCTVLPHHRISISFRGLKIIVEQVEEIM
ncbi:hypothetical protein TRIUR3_23518 [Triticum urartu]|uniref:Uncharacterized protein n=1 Tax=Triticum urartu TaxID=4572 RepID=M7YR49_TRIUA|nr:hypothetical protein TRIUR3_23518 [Triticum urartu]